MPFGNESSLVPLDGAALLKNELEQTRPWTTDAADALTEGVLNTYGTGTALRSMDANNYDPVANPGRSAAAVPPRDDVMSEDEWKASPQYREGVEYSPGMTPHRAQAIADQVDARKLREFYLQKRPIMSLAGGLAGGLLDPVNYVPVFGNAGAATLTGRLMLSAADAAINTGVAAVATSGVRAELGDDTSFGEIARQMAFAAGAGAILGGAFHVLGRSARAASRAATQAEVTKGAVVMNDAVDQLSRGQDIQLSPASQDVLASMEQSIATAKESVGFTVFHGSPHEFDRFSLDKIGTGEGAQAYGHGLYFAESPEVARGYKQALERRNIAATWDGKPVENWPKLVSDLQKEDWRQAKVVDELGRVGGDPSAFFRGQRDWYRGQPEMLAAVDAVEKRMAATHTPGTLYEARINADPNDFLDWDTPLSEQPNIQEKLARIGEATKSSTTTGGQKIGRLEELLPNRAAVTERLREAGIPGIKYLDAGSRADGEGSRNYVVFDDSLIEILSKNGEPVGRLRSGPMDHSAPTPEPVNTGELRAAETKVQAPVKPTFDPVKAQADEAKALGVDPESGTHDLADEIKSFKEQNLLTEGDLAELEAADREFEAAKAWGDVMEVARSCYLGG